MALTAPEEAIRPVADAEHDHPLMTDRLRLSSVATAPACTRTFARLVLSSWRVGRERIEIAELLISELVTNAVKATLARAEGERWPGLLEVRLLLFESRLVVEVYDDDLHAPVMQSQKPYAERGRGLVLVTSMSDRWGYYFTKAGKVVWCDLHLTGSPNDVAPDPRPGWRNP